MDEYTECHRALLTYIRSVRSISAERLEKRFDVLASALGAPEGPESMRQHIAAINVQLERFSFNIALIRDGDVLKYVFINTRFDEAIQGCLPYLPPELDAIKQLIDNIINAHGFEFGVPFSNAKHHAAAVLKLRASEADYLLNRLLSDGWMEMRANRITLSALSLAELNSYLIDRFGILSLDDALGKLLLCKVCEALVMRGHKCECPVAFHTKCLTMHQRSHETCDCGHSLQSLNRVGPAVPVPQQS